MFIALGLICIALGIRFTSSRPDAIFNLGPVDVTAYHLMFVAGLLCLVRGVWTWVHD
jgi:prolipoprotein diacylglyceryltransferase